MRRGFLSGVLAVALSAIFGAPASASIVDVDRAPVTLERLDFGATTGSYDVVVAGDLDGDEREDFARVVYADPGVVEVRFSGRPAGDPGLRIELDGYGAELTQLGDVDGDGIDDLGVTTWNGPVIVHGGRDTPVVRLGVAGEQGITRVASTRGTRLVGLGDRNADGRADFILHGWGSDIRVVYTPAGLGAVLDVDRLPADHIGALGTGEDVSAELVSHLVGTDEVVLGWNAGFYAGGRIASVPIPAPGTTQTAAAALSRGEGWRLAEDDVTVDAVTPFTDQDLDGRAELRVRSVAWTMNGDGSASGVGRTHLVRGPAPGARGTWQGGSDSSSWTIDLGDVDGDGRGDIADSYSVTLTSATARQDVWTPPSWTFTGAERSVRPVGTVVDRDGDGLREIVVTTLPNEGGAQDVRVLSSRALPPPGESGPESPPTDPSTWWNLPPGLRIPPPGDPFWFPNGLPEPAPAWTGARRASEVSELASTPEYAGGLLQVRIQAARGSRVEVVGTAAPWKGGTPEALAPAAGPADAAHPWVPVALTLSPASRSALERDGRLRLSLSTASISPRGAITRRTFSFVAVTRRAAPAVARRTTLKGGFGVQRLLGGTVDDLLLGESGDDVLRGRAGSDLLRGGTGNDTLHGDAGADVLDGDDGDDRLFGGPGDDDLIESRFGDDELSGGDGDDWIYGLRGGDRIAGGPGDDVIAGGSGADTVDCGPGEDVVFVNYSVERNRTRNCEHVWDEPGIVHVPCRIGGTEGDETVLGTEGRDVCRGLGGDDDLEGRGGHDSLDGGPGNDRLFGRFGNDGLLGGPGNDELEGGRGRDTLVGGPGNDRLNGGYDADLLQGGSGDDRIVARGGGVDTIDCGPGTDTAIVDSRDRVRGCERVDRSGRPAR